MQFAEVINLETYLNISFHSSLTIPKQNNSK